MVVLKRPIFHGACPFDEAPKVRGWAFISSFRSSCLTSERVEAPSDGACEGRWSAKTRKLLQSLPWRCRMVVRGLDGPSRSPTDRAEIGRISRRLGEGSTRIPPVKSSSLQVTGERPNLGTALNAAPMTSGDPEMPRKRRPGESGRPALSEQYWGLPGHEGGYVGLFLDAGRGSRLGWKLWT